MRPAHHELAARHGPLHLVDVGDAEQVVPRFPVRLEQYGEVAEALHHLHEVLRADPQQPERRAPVRAAPRKQQRTCRVLAEQRAEEG